LIVGQGMEARGQVLTVEQFEESGRSADFEGFNNMIGNETAKFIITESSLSILDYGSSEMLLLRDGASIRSVSASSQDLRNVVLMVVWIPTEDCVRDFINHYPNNLGQTLPNLKYVYVQGELAANDAQAI